MAIIAKEYSDHYAYDISKNVFSKGEVWDEDAIKQSIELIVATYFGNRLFNLSFGSPIWGKLFETMSPSEGERLLDGVANAIKKWDNRVQLLEGQMKIINDLENNSLTLVIPYVIKRSGKASIWQKKIIM